MHKESRMTGQRYLRGFWALIATQFQGAFNDSALKFLIIFYLPRLFPRDGAEGMQRLMADSVTAICGVLFILPFLIFPGFAGALADRYSKRSVAIATKYWEVGAMLLAVLAFYVNNPYFLWGVLFLMATQSAFFSPAKYGILPEILPEKRLSWGNGYLQMSTFLAIIAGTAAAGPLLTYAGDGMHLALWPLVGFSVFGVIASHFITRAPAADPGRRIPVNPWAGTVPHLRIFASERWLFLALLGMAYFWFAAALIQSNIVEFGKVTLALPTDDLNSYLQVALAVGIAAGGVSAGYLSGGKIEGGLVPLGAFGLTLFLALLGLPDVGYLMVLVLLFGLGFSAGFYDIPLAATVQERSPDHAKGGMIATANIVTSSSILLASVLFWVLFALLQLSPRTIFLIGAALTVVVAVVSVYFVPGYLLRMFVWVSTHTIYRLRVLGRENLPRKTGALLVANHTSFIDALAILGSIDRPVRFLMSQDIYQVWWIRPFARAMGALPISPTAGPRQIVESLRKARQAIVDGELVCIFAEGQITRTGQLLPFKKGLERIVNGIDDAPIVPVHLDQVWGSVFSFSEQRFFTKLPRRIPYPVTVSYGRPLPNTVSAFQVRRTIQELGSEAWKTRKLETPLLHRGFFRMARRFPFRMAMADMRTERMSYFKAAVATIILVRKLRPLLDDAPMTGVYVPPTVGGALTNIALQVMGKVAVNLNYTASRESLESAAEQASLRHTITSRAFLEKVPLPPPGEHIYLEDVMASVTKGDRIRALLLALFCPVRILERMAGAPKNRSQDDLAAIIFSSGSTGTPKGVMLSHANILSNIEAPLQVFPHEPKECMMGMLPFFHSFGFTGTLWLPLTYGFRVVFYPSPLDAKAIGGLCQKYRATFLIGTSTFFQNYIRRCAPEDFSSLKYVIAGAEKLTDRVREAFKEKFGIEPLEGYGATECSPIVALNIPDFRAPGFYQVGTRHGSVGHPIPGMSVKTVDPDTLEDLPDGEAGLLFVKGPNVMQGYLGMPDKTAEVLKDGWYNTGDVARIDEDGFIFITDRLARFSKIAGEMVPHHKVEDVLHEILGLSEQTFAVVGVPDAQKGERLVVLHTLPDDQLETLLSQLDKSGLPNLWIPRSSSFYRVEEIPVLGSGKLDLQQAKAVARSLDVGE